MQVRIQQATLVKKISIIEKNIKMVPALACIKCHLFNCHIPGAVVSQGISRPNAENCSGFPPRTRQSASIEAELLGLTSIYSELQVIKTIIHRFLILGYS